MLKCTAEVCSCRLVGQEIRLWSECLNDKVRSAVLQKRNVFKQWQQQSSEEAFNSYRVKAVVRKARRET